MSLYGNVKKIGSAAFQFDRKYASRSAMDAAAATDGVYAGRYVLVEYGERFNGTKPGDTVQYNGQPGSYSKIKDGPNGIELVTVYENDEFVDSANLDLRNYGATYDSTVWQKIYINENGVGKDKYVMVAELNAMAPKLDITQDAPLTYKALENNIENYRTSGIVTGKVDEDGQLIETVRLTNAEEVYNKPYFDTALDTELTYLMHLPTTLNLELDSETIDFNENGFNIAYSYPESDGVSTIAWVPKGHDDEGNPVYLDNYEIPDPSLTDNGNNKLATLLGSEYPMDTKMLFMSFPALGNAMNALYNLLYGKPDPSDDLTHGAMRPYFKQFLNGIAMVNQPTITDPADPSNVQYVTAIDDEGNIQKIYIEGLIGQTVEAILNDDDVEEWQGVLPANLVEIRYKQWNGNDFDYWQLDDENYDPSIEGNYVLWDIKRGIPLQMTIHVPTGDEDQDLKWLSSIPALSDILANNTTGLATVLSSLFNDTDPLTGTVKYFLHNDWTMSTEDGTSGPSIINKPTVVGGYEEYFNSVLAGEEDTNLAGEKIHESPGYNWDLSYYGENPKDHQLSYAHTERFRSEAFSGGHSQVNYDTWQLVDYSTPNISIIIDKLQTAPNDVNLVASQTNQDALTITQKNNAVLITSSIDLTSFTLAGESESGKWIALDLDTGFRAIQRLEMDGVELTNEDEEAAAQAGLMNGHILFWVRAETITEAARTIRFSAAGFNDTAITIQYKKI